MILRGRPTHRRRESVEKPLRPTDDRNAEAAVPHWYPPITPRAEGWLDVDGGHRVYWEESGVPDGIPVVFVHGGPGAGCGPVHRRFFDPGRYRIILFDQRGAGRSEPRASVTDNTTQHLIADMEQLREHLRVERWLVFGGSWGSTLALAYGQAHPRRCLGFILRGVFLCRQSETDWFLNGMGGFFPEAEQWFKNFIPISERHDVLAAYRRRLLDDDPAVHGPAARVWTAYEDACARLLPRFPPAEAPGTGTEGVRVEGLSMARLEAHYIANKGFVAEGQLLTEIGRIAHLPCIIVQGRYDVVCPPRSAYEVHRAWPGSRLVMVDDAGHSALEPGTQAALVAACDDFAAGIGVSTG
jgi:proline iminopeptidase